MVRLLLVFALIAVAACGADTAVAQSRRLSGMVLSAEGYGPVRIGMSVSEAEAALGAELPQRGFEEDAQCEDLAINGDVNSNLLFTVEQGAITRVSLYTTRDGPDRSILTNVGIGLGDNAAAVRAAYGTAVEEAPASGGGHDLYAWSSGDRGIRFEFNMDGKVWAIHAGAPSIRNDGCL